MQETILVSACLLGLNTRYSGETRTYPRVTDYLVRNSLTPIPVCPEQLAGLPTPRPRSFFTEGDGETLLAGSAKLCSETGECMDEPFRLGAEQALAIARLTRCRQALLKERSPSCGSKEIYRKERLLHGMGVTAALLKRHGLDIMSEEDI